MESCDVVGRGRWSAFSASGLRRRFLEALLCGVSSHQRKKREELGFVAPVASREPRSERLAELLEAEARESRSVEEGEKRRKIESFEELLNAVKHLQETGEGCNRRRADAAAEIRRLAKDSPDARQTIAMLGAIPPLVRLLDGEDSDTHISALYALLNLEIGNDANKAAIVKAGGIPKMLALVGSRTPPPSPTAAAIVAVFLGLSALDANKPIIGAFPGSIPFLINSFRYSNCAQAKDDALRALFNLSLSPSNAAMLIDSGLVPCLIAAIGDDTKLSERALSVLSNLVAASPEGRRALSRETDAFSVIIDVLNWSDEPGCQEKAAYILMVMAQKSRGADRAAMATAGITSALLELALVGSAIAQKRASRILQIFSEKGKEVPKDITTVSAPITSGRGLGVMSSAKAGAAAEEGISEERKAVRMLVEQSWQNNMWQIARRANLPADFAPCNYFRALTPSSTSKSLPF